MSILTVRERYRALVEQAVGEYTAAQDPDQFSLLLELLDARERSTILEIGTFHGGTAWLLAQAATDDAVIVSVDNGSWDQRDVEPDDVRRGDQRVFFVVGDSHDPETKAEVAKRLDGRPVDFLLIDGDHTYDGVRADFEDYLPLVRPGGLVAFHDILDWAAPNRQVEVWKLWSELKPAYRTWEFVEGEETAGIGVVEVPS